MKEAEEVKEIDSRDSIAKSQGAIKVIEVEGKRLYLKMPNRNIIGIAFAQMKINEMQGFETIARGSAIRELSDMDILENDTLFLSICNQIGEFLDLIELKKSTSRTL
jgi:hypothetical protein